jgi:hypothetical protein
MVLASPGLARIDLPLERIADLCRKYDVQELSLFGSILRDDFRSSDATGGGAERKLLATPGDSFHGEGYLCRVIRTCCWTC